MSIRRIVVLSLIFQIVCCASIYADDLAQPSTKPATTKPVKAAGPKVKSESDILADQLSSLDPAVQQAAVDKLKTVIAGPADINDNGNAKPGKLKFNRAWVTALLKVERYDDAEHLALQGIILNAAQSKFVSGLQSLRIQALLGEEKYDAALSASKAYYNVCGMAETESAIDTVCLALSNAREKEKGLARRFKMQQIAAATTQPANPPQDLGENVLKSITVDPAPFEEALKQIKLNNYTNLTAKGNLLLLSDRPKEAHDAFETASDLAKGPKEIAAVTESIARAIRAESGAIGPANAYIVAQQGN